MKPCLFISALLFIAFSISVKAQQTLSKSIDGVRYSFDNTTIVKDSTGTAVPFSQWTSMVMSQGYDVKPLPLKEGGKQEFQLFRKSSEEIARMKAANNNSSSQSLTAGSLMQKFSIRDIHGKLYDSTNLKGKMIVFNLWFVHCAPCVQEMPELNELLSKYKSKDVVFIAVTRHDTKAEVEEFSKKTKFDYALVPKEEANKLGFGSVSGFPSHIVVDKKGIIKYFASGYSPENIEKLKNVIESSL